MAYELRISERADSQIDRLASYLLTFLRNQQACAHFFDEIRQTLERLGEDPFCFKLCPEEPLARKGYRSAQLPTMRYRMIFRIEGKKVYIVAVFHMLEDYTQKL